MAIIRKCAHGTSPRDDMDEVEPTNNDVVASNMNEMRQGDVAGVGDAAGVNMVGAMSERSQVVGGGNGVAGATTVGVAGAGGGENNDGNEPSGQGEDRDVKTTRPEDIAEEEEEGKKEPVEEHHELGGGSGDVEGGGGVAPETERNSFDDEDEGEVNEDESHDDSVQSYGRGDDSGPEIIDLTADTDEEEKEAASESGEKGDMSNRPLKRQKGGEK